MQSLNLSGTKTDTLDWLIIITVVTSDDHRENPIQSGVKADELPRILRRPIMPLFVFTQSSNPASWPLKVNLSFSQLFPEKQHAESVKRKSALSGTQYVLQIDCK